MRRLSNYIAGVLCACLLAGLSAGCAPAMTAQGEEKLQIVATLFPQYDFARQVAGDRAEVTLLLPPGVESHSYEPTPADMVRMNEADLFVYTGERMEPWAHKIIDGFTGEVRVLDISEQIPLVEENAEEHADHAGHEEHEGFDPHIWTSPANARLMVDNLANALSVLDPENAGAYQTNAAGYKERLDALDAELTGIVESGKRREIVFGGRFAMRYFAEQYELDWRAAYDSCSSETEPSVRVMAELIDEVKTKGIPVIYYEELADPKVARAISGETGAKLLLLHSCHNVSKEELDNGATYLSLMEQNARNLKEGLN